MNTFTENEKDYPEKVIKKEDEEEKISDTTNVKKSKIAFNYDNKKKYLCIIVLFFICLTVNVLLFR